jgi:excisionase family DNA binding protein
MDSLLTINQVAELLNVSVRTVYNMRKERRIMPIVFAGKRERYDKNEILKKSI